MESTNTTLISYDKLTDGMKVNVDGIDGSLGTVTATGTTDIHDIFGDGSAVATYNLDGNVNDLSGNYNGNNPNNNTFVSGKFNTCLQNNTSDYGVLSGDFPSMTTFTISFWCKGNFAIGGYSTSGWSNAFSAHYYGTTDLFIGTDVNTRYTPSANPIDTSIWNHIVFSLNGTTMTCYANNSQFVSKTVTASNGLSKLIFGSYATNVTNYNGSIDQVRIFNRALTPTEINTLYNEQLTKYSSALDGSTGGTNFGLTNPPKYVFAKDGEVLTKVSSTLTEFVGTNPNSGLIQTGDSIQLDDTTDVVCSNVVEADVSIDTVNTHNIFGDGSAVATYNFDGDATDLGGNYNGTATNVTYSAGKFGQCAVFDGSSSKIALQQDAFGQPTQTWSVSAWVRFSSLKESTVVNFGGSTNGIAIGTLSDGTLLAGLENNGSLSQIKGNIANVGTWYHMVMTFDKTTVTLYINNELVGSSTSGYTNGNNGDAIGGTVQSPLTGNNINTFVNGSIDQVRIFNRALTASEVNTLYNEQIPKYQYTCTFPLQASAPTSAKVLDRSITTTEASDVYDATTGKFTKTYDKIQQQGRAFKWKVTADDGVEVSKITIPMNKL